MEGGNKMTREKQIKKQADIYTDDASNYTEWSNGWSDSNDIELIEKAFIEGAKWADEHPNISEEEQVGMGGLGMTWQKKALIDKACDWMKEALIDYWSGINADSSNFINDFKRAMEEQV